MSTRRSSVGVGVVGGIIYAVGGYDGNSRQCLASVEVYYPSEDTWKRVSDMNARRSGAGVGVVGGIIYAVGGHDGPLVRKSVECYNPDRDEWTAVSEMNNCRRNAGKLYYFRVNIQWLKKFRLNKIEPISAIKRNQHFLIFKVSSPTVVSSTSLAETMEVQTYKALKSTIPRLMFGQF